MKQCVNLVLKGADLVLKDLASHHWFKVDFFICVWIHVAMEELCINPVSVEILIIIDYVGALRARAIKQELFLSIDYYSWHQRIKNLFRYFKNLSKMRVSFLLSTQQQWRENI